MSGYFLDHRSQGELVTANHIARINVFRVDDPRSEPRVLYELTQNKMAEDAESDVAIHFVDENDYREISAKAVSAERKLKKNRPSWHVSKHCYDVDSSEAESPREEDEKVSAS